VVNLIARRAIFKTRAGGTLRVTQKEAVVLRALQLADDVPTEPVEYERTKGIYKRRDLTAESPIPAPHVEAQVVRTKPAVPAARTPLPPPKFTDDL
jgi:hypothetical protein